MDGFTLLLGVIGLASITSWIAMWNVREIGNLMEMRFETICIAIVWIAALLIALYLVV